VAKSTQERDPREAGKSNTLKYGENWPELQHHCQKTISFAL
jgi:hypothetical protein